MKKCSILHRKLRHNDAGSTTTDRHQFDLEDEVFTCKRMIGIECYRFWLNVGNHYGNHLAGSVGHVQTHTDLRHHIGRKIALGEFYQHSWIFGSVCLINRDIDGLLLSYCHAGNAVVESRNHCTAANFKFERIATF